MTTLYTEYEVQQMIAPYKRLLEGVDNEVSWFRALAFLAIRKLDGRQFTVNLTKLQVLRDKEYSKFEVDYDRATNCFTYRPLTPNERENERLEKEAIEKEREVSNA